MPMGGFGSSMFNPAMWMGGQGMPGMPGMPGMFPFMPGMMGDSGKGGDWAGLGPMMNGPGMPQWPGRWPMALPQDGLGKRRNFSRSRSRSGSRRGSRSRGRDGGKPVDSIRIARSLMGRVIGKAGATINEIREKSGARVDAEDRNDEQCEFKLSGRPECVAQAKSMIMTIVDKAQLGGDSGGRRDDNLGGSGEGGPVINDSLEFPVSATGGIIGSRGAKISEVRQQSGAKVQVEKLERCCKVLISGTAEQVDKARALVTDLAEESMRMSGEGGRSSGGRGRDDDGTDPVSDIIEFPLSVAGRIIGSRGSQISDVRQQSGARVSVEKLEDCCKVQISGTSAQVERARGMVRGLAEEGDRGLRRGDAEDLMEVPQSMVGRVIGKGGDTIQRLQRDSGARIDVNAKAGDPCPVRISGNRDAVARARYLINEVLDRGNLYEAGGRPPQSGPGYGGAWGPDAGAYGAAQQWPPGPMGYGMWDPMAGGGGGGPPGGSWDYPYGGGCGGTPERGRERDGRREDSDQQGRRKGRDAKRDNDIDMDEL